MMSSLIKNLENGLIQVEISKEMFLRAKERSESNFVNNHNSIFSDPKKALEANLIGNLGEEIFQTVFPFAKRINSYDYDFECENKTFDVKTKKCKGTPKLSYDVSVLTYSLAQQKCSHYAFCRVLSDYSKGFYLGFISASRMRVESIIHHMGDIDRSNGLTFKKDCYNMSISNLIR